MAVRLLAALGLDRWPVLQRWIFVAFYVAGLAFWMHFFNFGALDFDFEDWPKERVYVHLFRQSVEEAEFPFHVNSQLPLTQRVFGNPEMMVAPQLALLPLLSDGAFVILNVCLLFTAGFIGLLHLAKESALSFIGTLFLGLIIFFSGYLTSRLAVAHFMWASMLLAPWFLLLAHRFETRAPEFRDSCLLALLIFVSFLHGTFLMVTYWCFFWALYAAARPSRSLAVAVGLVIGGLLAVCRLAPAAVALGSTKRPYIGGYPSPEVMLRGLTQDLGYSTPAIVSRDFALGWWEFDCFIGWPAAGWLGVALILSLVRFRDIPRPQRYLAFGLPLAFLFVISLDGVYLPIKELGLPLLNAHRVLTRPIFIIVVMVAFVALRWTTNSTKWARWLQLSLWVITPLTAGLLFLHAQQWNLGMLEATHPRTAYFPHIEDVRNLDVQIVQAPFERLYKFVTVATLAFSAVGFAALLVAWRRLGHRPMDWNPWRRSEKSPAVQPGT